MKIKTGEKLSIGAALVFILLRAAQYVFVIDAEGFFIKETPAQSILGASLYAAMALFVILSLFFCFNRNNRYNARYGFAACRGVAYSSLLYALSLMVLAAVLLVNGDWLGFVALPAALYYILLAIRCDGKRVAVMDYMALFALAYPCARIIQMFFSTFKEIKASENVIDVISQCAMILAVIVVTKYFLVFEEKMTKVGWSLMIVVPFCSLAAISGGMHIVINGMDAVTLTKCISDLMFSLFGTIMLHACAKFVPESEISKTNEENE